MGNVSQSNFYHAALHDCFVYEEKKTYTNGTKGEQTKSVSTCINSLGSLSLLKCSVLRPLLSRRRKILENKESPNLSLKSEEVSGVSGLDRKQRRVGTET